MMRDTWEHATSFHSNIHQAGFSKSKLTQKAFRGNGEWGLIYLNVLSVVVAATFLNSVKPCWAHHDNKINKWHIFIEQTNPHTLLPLEWLNAVYCLAFKTQFMNEKPQKRSINSIKATYSARESFSFTHCFNFVLWNHWPALSSKECFSIRDFRRDQFGCDEKTFDWTLIGVYWGHMDGVCREVMPRK